MTEFNRLEVCEASRFIKISCGKYINKILERHEWLKDKHVTVKSLITYDKATLDTIATIIGPTEAKEIEQLQKEKGFKYC